MNKVSMYAPWVIYARKIQALFEKDPDVIVHNNFEDNNITLYVNDADKASALMELLPEQKNFGNVTITITINPSNVCNKTKEELLRDAFNWNPIVNHFTTIHPEGTTNPFTYCTFAKEIVQIAADNLGDEHGVISLLYEDIAREIFEDVDDGVYFCTDIE